MKKVLLSAILAVSALTASAQQQAAGTFAIEPHVGIGYSTLSGFTVETQLPIGYDYDELKGGISAELGADVIYKFSDAFGVSAGLSFNAFTSDEINKFKLEMNTLDIPLLAHYNFTPNFGAFAGLKLSFPLSIKSNVDGDKTSCKDKFKSTNLLLPLGVKWTFNSNWSISAQYNFSLSKINDVNLSKDNDDTKLSPIMLNVGYRFQL